MIGLMWTNWGDQTSAKRIPRPKDLEEARRQGPGHGFFGIECYECLTLPNFSGLNPQLCWYMLMPKKTVASTISILMSMGYQMGYQCLPGRISKVQSVFNIPISWPPFAWYRAFFQTHLISINIYIDRLIQTLDIIRIFQKQPHSSRNILL